MLLRGVFLAIQCAGKYGRLKKSYHSSDAFNSHCVLSEDYSKAQWNRHAAYSGTSSEGSDT